MNPDRLELEHLRDLDLAVASHPRGLPYLSAASGIVLRDNQLIVVADDEHHIGVFDISSTQPGRLLRVLAGDLPQDEGARKKLKPDMEALCILPEHADWRGGALFAPGSGSRPNRQMALLMPFEAPDGGLAGPTLQLDMTALYAPLREHFADLNIEGAFVREDELLLLQRGNAASPNASIAFPLPAMMDWLAGSCAAAAPRYLRLQYHDLGRIGTVPLCFTDGAALPDGGWMFSAVAENTDNSYADGVFTGAIIGVMDTQGTLLRTWALPALKIEGIALRQEEGSLIALMVTDADDPARAAALLRLRLPMSALA